MRFNAPPGWTVPAPDWLPDTGWAPDPAWPPAPPGWQFFIEDPEPTADGAPPHIFPNAVAQNGNQATRSPQVMIAAGAAVLVVALLGFVLVRLAVSKTDDAAADSSSAIASKEWTVVQSAAAPSGGATPITFDGMRDFVFRHYADLPTNPRATWDRLDSQFTARLSWSDYASFWATIRSVSVTSVQPDGPDSVIARLTLVPHRGNTSSEQRRITFVSTGGVMQIHRSDLLG